jgi:uncharacterized protein YndB with AHSA1/START domain
MAVGMDLTIRKTLHVDAPVERAFEVFTDGVAGWWPFDTHSIEGKAEPELQLQWREGGVNGELVDGELRPWYDVLAYEPPARLLLRWRVNPEKPATQVEVTFAAEGEGTRVELTHSGWEAYGAEEDGGYDGYNQGWDAVLGHYVEFFGRE